MVQTSKQESFKGIYSLHAGGLIEFTFFPSSNGQEVYTVKCTYDGQTYQFTMLPDTEKGNYIISNKKELPTFITDHEEDLAETIFNQYHSGVQAK